MKSQKSEVKSETDKDYQREVSEESKVKGYIPGIRTHS